MGAPYLLPCVCLGADSFTRLPCAWVMRVVHTPSGCLMWAHFDLGTYLIILFQVVWDERAAGTLDGMGVTLAAVLIGRGRGI